MSRFVCSMASSLGGSVPNGDGNRTAFHAER